MNQFRSIAALILFCGLAGYVALGGTFAQQEDCFRCYASNFGKWIEAGYRPFVAAGLFATGIFSFFWWRTR